MMRHSAHWPSHRSQPDKIPCRPALVSTYGQPDRMGVAFLALNNLWLTYCQPRQGPILRIFLSEVLCRPWAGKRAEYVAFSLLALSHRTFAVPNLPRPTRPVMVGNWQKDEVLVRRPMQVLT